MLIDQNIIKNWNLDNFVYYFQMVEKKTPEEKKVKRQKRKEYR